MKLVYLLENTLIMFGPYLVFVLLQSINLLTTDYLIARDINYIMYMGKYFFYFNIRNGMYTLWT